MSSIELRNFLFINKITQEQFGKIFGVSRQSVNAWCMGKIRIPQRVVDYCKDYEDDTYNKKITYQKSSQR